MKNQANAQPCGKVFETGRSQAVRIPKAFRFDCDEVFIEKDGDRLILTPKARRKFATMFEYIEHGPRLSDDFPDDIPDFPIESLRPVKF